jgi:hypothetical protein
MTEEELREAWSGGADGTPTEECLAEEDWPRLMAGEASRAERQRAAQHLATCAACADEYRALHALRPLAEEAERAVSRGDSRRSLRMPASWLSPVHLALAASLALVIGQIVALYWVYSSSRDDVARLEARLVLQEESLAAARAALAEEQRRQRLESAGAPEQMAALRASVADLSAPRLGMPIVDLDARPATREAASQAVPVVEVPSHARLVTLILNFQPLSRASDLLVTVADERGERVWEARTSRAAGTASLNLTLGREGFPSGVYAIRVSAPGGDRETLVADYRVRLRHQEQQP